jgi:predicted HicB family RNase H-like nuclease
MNVMKIEGHKAVINYDPEIELFRGEFIGINGHADFYAADVTGLKKEGALSLKVFLEMCEEDGVSAKKEYSGKFNMRIPSALHAEIVIAAASTGKSLNQWAAETLERAVHNSGDHDGN